MNLPNPSAAGAGASEAKRHPHPNPGRHPGPIALDRCFAIIAVLVAERYTTIREIVIKPCPSAPTSSHYILAYLNGYCHIIGIGNSQRSRRWSIYRKEMPMS